MRSVFSLQFFFKYPTLRKTHVRECKKRERGRRGEEKKCPSYGKVVCLSFSRGQGDWVSFCERRNGYRKCVSNLLIVDWMSVCTSWYVFGPNRMGRPHCGGYIFDEISCICVILLSI